MIPAELESSIRSAWTAATAAGPDSWQLTNPAAGHCDVTALIIREQVGGDLVHAHVFRDGEFSENHYWNVLPDGTEFDLTREQFDGSEDIRELARMDAAAFEAAGPMQPELVRRLDLFRSRVESLSIMSSAD